MHDEAYHPTDASEATTWMVGDGRRDFAIVTDSFARLLGETPFPKLRFRQAMLARKLFTTAKDRTVRKAVRSLVRSTVSVGYHSNIDLPSGSRVSPLAYLSSVMEDNHFHLRLQPFDSSIEEHVSESLFTVYGAATELALKAREEHSELVKAQPNTILGIQELLNEPTFVYSVIEPVVHGLFTKNLSPDQYDKLGLGKKVTVLKKGKWSLKKKVEGYAVDSEFTVVGDLCGVFSRAITQLEIVYEGSSDPNLWWLGEVAPIRAHVTATELAAATAEPEPNPESIQAA